MLYINIVLVELGTGLSGHYSLGLILGGRDLLIGLGTGLSRHDPLGLEGSTWPAKTLDVYTLLLWRLG